MRVEEPPGRGEIEVSIFGTGFGESLAIHVGESHWLVVDSCLNGDTPAALRYLDALGRESGHVVEVIVVTHWDGDHVNGTETLMERFPRSLFVTSRASASEEFQALMELERRFPNRGRRPGRGAEALARIMRDRLPTHEYRLVQAGLPPPVLDMTLPSGTPLRVEVLAPSHVTVSETARKLGEQIETWDTDRRIRWPVPNDQSVVLWIEIGDCRLLLGGDLQRSGRPGRGWTGVVDRFVPGSPQAQLYKVPHHGSPNAHEPRVWETMVELDAVAPMTRFVRSSNPPPPDAAVDRMRGSGRAAWVVGGEELSPTNRWRLPGAPGTRRRWREGYGHVRLRRNLGDRGWRVDQAGRVQGPGEPPPGGPPPRHGRRRRPGH